MNKHSTGSNGADKRMVILALFGFVVTAFVSLGILSQTWSTVSVLATNPQVVLQSTLSSSSPLISLTVGVIGMMVTVVSIWSISSLLVAEFAVWLGNRRAISPVIRTSIVRFASPIVRPLVRKRLASLVLTGALVGGAVPAFATTSAEIPTDLGWQSIPAVQEVSPDPLQTPPTTQVPLSEDSMNAPKLDVTDEVAGQPGDEPADEPPNGSPSQGHLPHASTTLEQTGVRYVVKEGDSLWAIASRHMETTNPAAINRGWKQIYELNRAVIGESPNLILPDTVLDLPDKKGM